jgi:uncharacterized protein DUF6882
MSPEFETLYHRHILTSFEKQLRLADVVGALSWSFSMDDGLLMFEDDGKAPPVTFAVQLLGTAADRDSTWLWSWANAASQIPPPLTQDAQRLRGSGAAPEFADSTFVLDLDNADDHRMALTSSGLLTADAYYRGPYNGGAAFFLLRDERLRLPAPDGPRIVRTISEAISGISIADHRAAITAYFGARGLNPRTDGENAVVGTMAAGELRAEFDMQGRLADLRGTLRPS